MTPFSYTAHRRDAVGFTVPAVVAALGSRVLFPPAARRDALGDNTMPEKMTKAECQKRLEELEAEADRRGCCVIPATPVKDPADIPQEANA